MRAVVLTGPGVVELNFLWLPTFVGANTALQKSIADDITSKLVGLPVNDETLDYAHDLVVKALQEKLPALRGLDKFLDGLKHLELHDEAP